MEFYEKLFSSQYDRGNYTPEVGYKNIFLFYEGIIDENKYNFDIYKTNDIVKNRKDIILFTKGISSPNNNNIINYYKKKINSYSGEISNLDLRIVQNKQIEHKIKNAIDCFVRNNNNEFSNEIVKNNFIVKVLSWIREYFEYIEINKKESPAIIFYGDIKKHELFLLIIMHLAQFDILYLNPNRNSDLDAKYFSTYSINKEVYTLTSNKLTFEDRSEDGEKIDKQTVKKASTVANQASIIIGEDLLNSSGFIRPWQLQDRMLKSLILSTTIDEILLYWEEQSKLKPGFEFNDREVVVPVLFSKINGIYENEKIYIEFVNNLKRNKDNAIMINFTKQSDNITKEFTSSSFSLSFYMKNNIIDKESIIEDEQFSIYKLNDKVKRNLLTKVEEVIENQIFKEPLTKEDIIKGLFSVLNMDKQFIRCLNNFDYSGINPKIILFMKEGFKVKKEIVFLLLVLNKIGFDVLTLSPSGEESIERVIHSQILDIHRIDKMVYDYDITNFDNKVKQSKFFSKVSKLMSGSKWK